jgi:putative ABC transport system substrate-binding protein
LSVTALPIHEAADITAAISDLGHEPGGGLVPPDPFMAGQHKLITELAARYRLPAICGLRLYVANGGLISYGINIPDLFRQAALYVDRILRGESPADLPVVLPTKFEFVLNLQTAKALGLDVPSTLSATVDEVIE